MCTWCKDILHASAASQLSISSLKLKTLLPRETLFFILNEIHTMILNKRYFLRQIIDLVYRFSFIISSK